MGFEPFRTEAAGYDRSRLVWCRECQVINFKNAKLGPTGARPICKRHVEIGGDVVVDDWEAKLIEQGMSCDR